MTNPPFTYAGGPRLHYRDLTPAELDQWRRMIAKQHELHKASTQPQEKAK